MHSRAVAPWGVPGLPWPHQILQIQKRERKVKWTIYYQCRFLEPAYSPAFSLHHVFRLIFLINGQFYYLCLSKCSLETLYCVSIFSRVIWETFCHTIQDTLQGSAKNDLFYDAWYFADAQGLVQSTCAAHPVHYLFQFMIYRLKL